MTLRTAGLDTEVGVAACTMDGFTATGVWTVPFGTAGGASHGARPGGAPMSTPADMVTSSARTTPTLAGHGKAPNHGTTRRAAAM